jgi:hypothetical protein
MQKTHCKRGHEFTEENTYTASNGSRHCKECRKGRMRTRRDGTQTGYYNSRKTHCLQGHPYDEENTIVTIRANGKSRRWCKACEKQNQYRQRIKRYGITVEQYEQMLADQNDRCAICFNEFDREPHIDHCHSSEKVRALLCFSCNAMLGSAKDNVDTLKKAIAYLESFSETDPE